MTYNEIKIYLSGILKEKEVNFEEDENIPIIFQIGEYTYEKRSVSIHVDYGLLVLYFDTRDWAISKVVLVFFIKEFTNNKIASKNIKDGVCPSYSFKLNDDDFVFRTLGHSINDGYFDIFFEKDSIEIQLSEDLTCDASYKNGDVIFHFREKELIGIEVANLQSSVAENFSEIMNIEKGLVLRRK